MVVRRFGAQRDTMFRQLIKTGLLRSWLGFCAVTFLAWAGFLVIDRDNPLRSDDPYVAGFLCGGFAAAMGVVYSLVEKACASRVCVSIVYFAMLASWSMLLVALSAQAPEGAEIGRFVAVAHLLSGAISWPLFAFRIPRSMVKFISGTGLVVFAMYCVVALRMAAIHSTG